MALKVIKVSRVIGFVTEVSDEKISLELDKELTNFNLLINGNLYRIGQVGMFLQIYVGLVKVIIMVDRVYLRDEDIELEGIKRYLDCSLLGFIDAKGKYINGSDYLPTIGDEVSILEERTLKTIFETDIQNTIKLGNSSLNDDIEIYANLNDLVLRHTGIFGNTGSGKSNFVGYLLHNLATSYPNSRSILIDIHGEYTRYISGFSKTYSIQTNDNYDNLHIPYWLLKFDDLAKIVGLSTYSSLGIKSQYDTVAEIIVDLKRENASEYGLSIKDINRDTPIKYDIKKLWYHIHHLGYATFISAQVGADVFDFDKVAYDQDTKGVDLKGDASNLEKPVFKEVINKSIYRTNWGGFQTVADNLYRILKNNRYEFLFGDNEYSLGKKSIADLITNLIDNSNTNVTILNLSGIPHELMDIVIGSLLDIIFELIYNAYEIHSLDKTKCIKESRPLLICMDESHRYMVKDNNSLSFQSIQKIMKEGRKFGIGAWIISQRPSNISPDILSQIGTFIGLRMTNREDSNSIKVFAQNNIGNFLNNLSGLKIGEAVGVGVSIKTPARFKIPLLDTVKNIKFDEQIDKWKRNYQDDNQYDDVVNKWRRKI